MIIQNLQDMTRICRKSDGLPPLWRHFFPTRHQLAGRLEVWTGSRTASTCLGLVLLESLEPLIAGDPAAVPLHRLLSPPELALLDGYRFAKRRREWLGGRLACKQCLLILAGEPVEAAEITILPDQHGRPRITGYPGRDLPSISISHSGSLAVAMACRQPGCGIDIQEIQPRISGLAERIGERRELALLAQTEGIGSEAPGLTMLWAAKEAAKKSLLHDQPSFFSGIRLLEILRGEETVFLLACARPGEQTTQLPVTLHRLDGYILACTEVSHA